MTANPNKQVIVDAVKSPGAFSFLSSSSSCFTPIASSMIVSGHLVFLAGAIGTDKDGKFVEGDIKARTKQAFANIEERLSVIGLSLDDIVSTTIFLSRYDTDFTEMNKAYAELFPESNPVPKPCRTCVGVAALPAGTNIEIQCVAAKRS
ncbi:hypothetical protein JCM8547_007560 [Rhodosporidiobolus lusitaniae]